MSSDSDGGDHCAGSPLADLRGQRPNSTLHVSKTIEERNEDIMAFLKELSLIMDVSPFLSALSLRWKLCDFAANVERRCLLCSWRPRLDDRNGETFLQAEILWLENHSFLCC